LGVFAVNQLNQINESALVIGNNTVPSIVALNEIRSSVGLYRQAQLQHIIAASSTEMDGLQAEMAVIATDIDNYFEQYKVLLSNSEEEAKMNLCKAIWQKYLEQSSLFLEVSRRLETDLAIEILNGQSRDTFDQFMVSMEEWRGFNLQISNDTLKDVQAVYNTARNLVMGVIVTAAIFAFGVGFYLARSIARPVQTIAEAANRLAQGDFSQRVEINSRDEVGLLAQSFNQMVDNIQQLVESERQAKSYLEQMVNKYVAFVGQVSKGNLVARLTLNGQDDPMTILGHNLNQMVEQLSELTAQIREASSSLSSAAAEILSATMPCNRFREQVSSQQPSLKLPPPLLRLERW
jgi:methyl-accepting chemotaxis protein